MKKIELLAPAGNLESLLAAVHSGADAVYFGYGELNARRNAKNFDEDSLREASRICKERGVKMHMTVNTMVYDREYEQVMRTLEIACRYGIDALIVQDLGVAALVRKAAPEMPMHASTQLTVHNLSGALEAKQLGFSRVVLAREMSRSEIAAIASQAQIETEVFVHGALCMCVSGQCYMSSVIGERSGNRGLCAQPCRLPFSVGKVKDGHALSLKDNSIIPYITQLEEMGVASAKIEGRMKRPEYVSAAVRACKEQRDSGFISGDTAEILKSVFSRTGFTDGYYTGKTGYEMFGYRRKNDVVAADEKLFAKIRQSYKDELSNIAISGIFTAKIGENPTLEISDGSHTVKVSSDFVCQKAEKVALDKAKCETQLKKTGSTAYFFDSLSINTEDSLSLPLSVLNAMRRDALARLDDLRAVWHNYIINNVEITEPDTSLVPKGNAIRARMTTAKFSPAFKECELVYVPIFTDSEKLKSLIANGYNIGVEIPRGLFKNEDRIAKRLAEVKQLGINDALCGNLAAVYMAKSEKMRVHGGFGLNLVNTYDLLWAEEYGFEDVELSFELTFERINRLGGTIKRGIITYGHLPLMLTVNCPAKSENISCKTCKNSSKMTDRKGEKFPLKCDGICTEVLNCVPLYISEKEFSTLSTSFYSLRLSVENYVESVKSMCEFTENPMLKVKSTRGLYLRGVK